MFGYVTANCKELTQEQQLRYNGVYCGICRHIRSCASQCARLGLQYDMAFLALLLMSLYEPEEESGNRACMLHPIKPHAWISNEYVRYAAEMNVALAYYKARDDVSDDGSLSGRIMANVFARDLAGIQSRYPRQCQAMERTTARLHQLEQENCDNPDLPAGCFGELMGELLVYKEDLWAPTLRHVGDALGRFIYLTDAAVDYRRDQKHRRYNPFLAMGTGEDWPRWEAYLLLAMARCTTHFEKLPLVQDKALLDKILYSGVWVGFKRVQPRKSRQQEVTNVSGSI